MNSDHPGSTDGPAVGFGSYVKPETVKRSVQPEPELTAIPFITARPVDEPPKPERLSEKLGRTLGPALLAAWDTILPMLQAAWRRAVPLIVAGLRAIAPLVLAVENRLLRADRRVVTLGLVGVATFLLGVSMTLYLAGGSQASVAELEETEPFAASPAIDPAQPKPAVPDALAAVVNASLDQNVTRAAGADLISPQGAMSQPDAEALSMTEILLGLRSQRGVAVSGGEVDTDLINRNKLQMLREHVLAGTYTVKTVKRNGQARLCLRVPKGNVTQDEAADMIRAAAERGEIELPESLNTADGSFDADTLIFNLVQTSLATDGTEAGRRAAREMSAKAAAASKAKTSNVQGERTYVVEPGDSLAYISLQFYGAPSAYIKIFEANRSILTSPDKIKIGQRLIIPG